jgi:Ricin-type beta-trefoil lectin domain-like
MLPGLLIIAGLRASMPNVLLAQPGPVDGGDQFTASPPSLSFGDQKVSSLSSPQTITITASTGLPGDFAFTVTGQDAGDFIQANTSEGGSFGFIYEVVAFMPRLPGPKSAVLTIADTNSNGASTVVIPLTGNSVMSGTFEIVNSLTAKVLDVAGRSASNGTLIEQNSFDGLVRQQWEFVPTAGGYFKILNAATRKVLDVTGESTADGAQTQLWDYLGGANQQWQVVPVDDVHYKIVNQLSGKVLDVRNGSTANGTPIQQWDYLGDPQQLWALIPQNPYNVANTWSGKVLDVTDGSTDNGALVQQSSVNGNRQQQWQFVPVGRGYYAILNRITGKVLDDVDNSTSDGTFIQQWDYLRTPNQQWQLMPLTAQDSHGFLISNALNFEIVNRLSGKVLDNTGSSTSNGSVIQQWSYLGNANQQWQLVPLVSYNIKNLFSNLVLDVRGGSTANGAFVQQWASNGNLQQQWQAVPVSPVSEIPPVRFPRAIGSAYFAFINVLTGKALTVKGGSTSNGALIDQAEYSSAPNQQWFVQPVSGFNGVYEIRNARSGKALDDTKLSNGTLMQQWDYVGGANQSWEFVPVSH